MTYPSIEMLYIDDNAKAKPYTLLPDGQSIKQFSYKEIPEYFPLGNNDMHMVIKGWDKNLDALMKIVKYFRDKKIKKINFFIEDIFRLRNENFKRIETLDCNKINYAFELDVVDYFLTQLNYESFDIYHCELDEQNCFKKNLKFFDAFLTRLQFLNDSVILPNNKVKTFEYKFCCFNGRFQSERYIMSCFLSNYNSFITNLYQASDDEMMTDGRFYLTRFDVKNQIKILTGNKLLPKKIKKIDIGLIKLKTDKLPSLLVTLHKNTQNTMLITQRSFCEIVTETNFSRHLPNISEKTMKVCVSGRPFILVAPPKTLELLKTLGFQTFESIWDESYDSIENDADRLQRIFQLIEEIDSWPLSVLKKKNKRIKEILIHNRNHFLDKSYLKVMRNLSP